MSQLSCELQDVAVSLLDELTGLILLHNFFLLWWSDVFEFESHLFSEILLSDIVFNHLKTFIDEEVLPLYIIVQFIFKAYPWLSSVSFSSFLVLRANIQRANRLLAVFTWRRLQWRLLFELLRLREPWLMIIQVRQISSIRLLLRRCTSHKRPNHSWLILSKSNSQCIMPRCCLRCPRTFLVPSIWLRLLRLSCQWLLNCYIWLLLWFLLTFFLICMSHINFA